jgi:hypothetical protein
MDAAASQNIYSRALAEAKSELSGITYEIETLTKRKAQLEAVVANLAPLLPQVSPTLKFPPAENVVSSSLPPQPIWKSILLGINGKGDSFTVKDAIEALERIGRPVESPNRFQIVRNVLKKKTENFESLSTGVFRVRRAEQEKEVASEEGTS